ncbi:MAG: hypothetical protein KDA61_15425, partial [Planctomycetales bacterium]|nr:hypothetical protein [Planctomycetales bacterium]
AGTTSLPMFPIQDVILPAMSAFNTLAEDVLADDVTAKGASIFTRQAQVGSTILLTDGNFFGTGTHPLLGRFELLTGAAYGFDPMTARLENVVQDASHPGFATGDPASVISADLVEFVVPNYGVNLLDLGVSLEVRDSFYFTSTFDGLPPSPGTPYTADPYEGPTSMLPAYLAGTNEVVAYSTQRRLEALPEPSAGALFVTALGVAKFFSRRRVVVGR